MLPGTVHWVHCAVTAAVLVSLTNHSHSRDDSVSCVRATDVALDSINSSQLAVAVAQLFEIPPHTHAQQAGREAAAASQRGADIMTGWAAEAGRLLTPPMHQQPCSYPPSCR